MVPPGWVRDLVLVLARAGCVRCPTASLYPSNEAVRLDACGMPDAIFVMP
ncbi:hypothetical protein [Azospirillum argentinense]